MTIIIYFSVIQGIFIINKSIMYEAVFQIKKDEQLLHSSTVRGIKIQKESIQAAITKITGLSADQYEAYYLDSEQDLIMTVVEEDYTIAEQTMEGDTIVFHIQVKVQAELLRFAVGQQDQQEQQQGSMDNDEESEREDKRLDGDSQQVEKEVYKSGIESDHSIQQRQNCNEQQKLMGDILTNYAGLVKSNEPHELQKYQPIIQTQDSGKIQAQVPKKDYEEFDDSDKESSIRSSQNEKQRQEKDQNFEDTDNLHKDTEESRDQYSQEVKKIQDENQKKVREQKENCQKIQKNLQKLPNAYFNDFQNSTGILLEQKEQNNQKVNNSSQPRSLSLPQKHSSMPVLIEFDSNLQALTTKTDEYVPQMIKLNSPLKSIASQPQFQMLFAKIYEKLQQVLKPQCFKNKGQQEPRGKSINSIKICSVCQQVIRTTPFYITQQNKKVCYQCQPNYNEEQVLIKVRSQKQRADILTIKLIPLFLSELSQQNRQFFQSTLDPQRRQKKIGELILNKLTSRQNS